MPLSFGTPKPSGEAPAETSSGHGFFHDLLDVINPLQHIPVIATIYRAITGEHIGTLEKIAGDTLYGGLWGAVSSVADTAFEAVTGKDFGSSVLALFTGTHDEAPKAVAVKVPQAQPAVSADVAALSKSLAEKGIDGDLARRAMLAYQKSVALPAMAN
jgi:hypothetical protein